MRTAYTDGACRLSNPGLCACAWVLYEDGVEKIYDAHYLGPEFHTNNFAEYMGLISLLEFLYTFSIRNVTIYCDSLLIVNQVLRRWASNHHDMRVLSAKAYGLVQQGCHELKHIKGHEGFEGNERADQLCNLVLDEHMEEYYAGQNKT